MSSSLPEGSGPLQSAINEMFARQDAISLAHRRGANINADDTYAQPKKLVREVAGAYRTWRLWKLTDYDGLTGIAHEHLWAPGENVINDPLLRTRGWFSGFHGFFDPSEIKVQEPDKHLMALEGMSTSEYMRHQGVSGPDTSADPFYRTCYVIGSALHYGKVRIAVKGVRSEKALPEYLILSGNEDFNLRLLSVAEKYRMKLVTLEEAYQIETGLIEWKREAS